MRTCTNCKGEFEVEKKRGRPPLKCEACRFLLKTEPKVTKETSQLKAWEPKPKAKVSKLSEKLKAKNTPTKGNARYSRQAFIEYMETNGVPIGAKAVDEAIKQVRKEQQENV